MPITDPVADMLTCIRNANLAFLERTEMPHSKLKAEIAKVLKAEGYIDDFSVVGADGAKPRLRVTLRYAGGRRRVITGIQRISKPGLRVYAGREEVPLVLGGLGISILTTPKGVMTGREARKQGIGGEVIAHVW